MDDQLPSRVRRTSSSTPSDPSPRPARTPPPCSRGRTRCAAMGDDFGHRRILCISGSVPACRPPSVSTAASCLRVPSDLLPDGPRGFIRNSCERPDPAYLDPRRSPSPSELCRQPAYEESSQCRSLLPASLWLLPTITWRDHALCRDTDPDLFFPIGTTGNGTAASRLCQAGMLAMRRVQEPASTSRSTPTRTPASGVGSPKRSDAPSAASAPPPIARVRRLISCTAS